MAVINIFTQSFSAEIDFIRLESDVLTLDTSETWSLKLIPVL